MKKRIQSIIQQLNHGLIEREEAIRLALLSALCGEHLLLLGEPGTAKSVLARKLHWAFDNGEYFERLLTKFSVPEELFGPLSIKALENDNYLRLTERYLPAASIAFIDEIFKANSAILNALLTLLNEREFDNGNQRLKVPLISVIAASNELPEEDGLSALYDRFLCRYQVHPVTADNFSNLLLMETESTHIEKHLQFNEQELTEIQHQAEKLSLPEDVIALLNSLRSFLQQQKIYISDRRWRKVIKFLKVAAYSNGQTSVSIWDCYLLQHCLWHTPEQRQQITQWYHTQIGMSSQQNLQTLEKLVLTWEKVLQTDQNSEVQRVNDENQLLYLNRQGEISIDQISKITSTREGQPLFIAPPGEEDRNNNGQGYDKASLKQQFFDDRYQQTHIDGHWVSFDQYILDPDNLFIEHYSNKPYMKAKKHSSVFIEGRLKESANVASEITKYQQHLQQQLSSAEKLITEHLWLLPDFVDQANSGLSNAITQSDQLLSRLQTVMNNYQQLTRL